MQLLVILKKNFILLEIDLRKPLYYGTVNNTFIFSSELKAISKFPISINQYQRKVRILFKIFISTSTQHYI